MVAQPCLGVAQPTIKDRKVRGGWPSRLYSGPAGYMVGGLQDFSVSPSPLLGLFGLELVWTGLELGLGGLGTKGLGTRA